MQISAGVKLPCKYQLELNSHATPMMVVADRALAENAFLWLDKKLSFPFMHQHAKIPTWSRDFGES